MVEINSMIMEPMDINENTFSSNIYNNATFYIPKGTMSLYKAREGWKKFVWIEEKEMTGINNTIKMMLRIVILTLLMENILLNHSQV